MKVETIVNCWQKMSILPIINNDDMQQALIADEITNQENQEAIKTLLQITIDESLKTNINQYLEIVDLTVSIE